MTDLTGRTFFITGANTGIGRATAAALAARGGTLYLACRSASRGEATVASLKQETGNDAISFCQLDLADLASVRACASSFLAADVPLHVLINNAGVAGQRGITRDGFELTFGVNHLGHWALTTALLDRLAASGQARVVNVSSEAHYGARGIDFGALRRRTASISGMREYAVSKLCNVLFTQELARRLAGTSVTTYALHPGVVASDIWRRIPWPVRPLMKMRMISNEQGATTSVYCATSPEVSGQTGLYYDKCREKEPSGVATEDLAAELWKHSESWTSG